MVYEIYKFGITYILPNNSWFPRCFCPAKLVFYAVHAQCMHGYAAMAIRCPGRAGNHPRRALVCGVCFVQRFQVCPLPPGVPEKRGGSQATAHALRHTAF